jgi:hypothetical protein
MLAIELIAREHYTYNRVTSQRVKTMVTSVNGYTQACLVSSRLRLPAPAAEQRLSLSTPIPNSSNSQDCVGQPTALTSISADSKMPITTTINDNDGASHMSFPEPTERVPPTSAVPNLGPAESFAPAALPNIPQSGLLLALTPHIPSEQHPDEHAEAPAS